jgi:hypothetical protein
MDSKTQNSDAETELAGARRESREARFLNPKTLKVAFMAVTFGLRLWRWAAKLWEWFS